MMHGTKKSHSSIVPAKPANKAERVGGGRRPDQEECGEAVSQAQARIREAVNRNTKEKLDSALASRQRRRLAVAFFNLKKQAAPGVDGLTWVDYAADLEQNLADLHARVHSGAYRALPSHHVYIPKADD
jgi:RNA-directed DNA polymerase